MRSKRYGAALDIGTSRIEGFLVDLDSRKTVAFVSLPNRQLVYGSDVISRLNVALNARHGLKRLHASFTETVDDALGSLISRSEVSTHLIREIMCVGNAALFHLAYSLSPDRLARAPFESSAPRRMPRKRAKDIGITVCPDARFEFLGGLGGFVGSDALAVIIATGIYASGVVQLVIDLGSNGEVIMGHKKRMLVASTSAGPAFEGWRIRCGMPAVRGAIESVTRRGDRDLQFRTIGNVRPRGLCGSALIDIMKYLLDTRRLDATGRLTSGRYRIAGSLYITQEDIRELQLAKAAIQAAIALLRKKFRQDIADVFITGRFGSRLSAKNAQAIGIIPADIDLRRVHFLDHGAAEGARAIMCSAKISHIARRISRKIVHVKLHGEHDFQDAFVSAMSFR